MSQLRSQLSAVVALVAALVLIPYPALATESAHRARPEAAPAPLRPLEMVSGSVARVQAIVRAQQAGLTETSEIRRIAEDLFDFDDKARRMPVPRWHDRTPEEQKEFVGLFTNLLERTWADRHRKGRGREDHLPGRICQRLLRASTAAGHHRPGEGDIDRIPPLPITLS